MHILDFGKPYADNLDDFFLHNKMAQSVFTQSIIQRECIDRGLDWHNVDIMLALYVGDRILDELKKNGRITYTERDKEKIQKYELEQLQIKEVVSK